MPNNKNEIIQQLSNDISNIVGNVKENDLQAINDDFYKILKDNLENFNSSNFDTDGFIKRFSDIDVGNKNDKDMIKRILSGAKTDYVGINEINSNDVLLKRDIFNICTQMPEMRDVIYTVRDSIIESDVVTGEISRSLMFQNNETENNQTIVRDLEKQFDLQMAVKNFIVPQTLMIGEFYINVVPYAKLFAEVEAVQLKQNPKAFEAPGKKSTAKTESINTNHSLNSEENLKYIKESVSVDTISSVTESREIATGNVPPTTTEKRVNEADIKAILENISVFPEGSSVLMQELGVKGIQTLLKEEVKGKDLGDKQTFFENVINGVFNGENEIEDSDIPYKKYSHIKGCYIKYLDSLRVVPIRLDRRIIGYCYVSTQANTSMNPAQPNGIVDVSAAHYTKDKQLVNSLADIVIKSFSKQMLDNNIKLKGEIADVIMAHRFSDSILLFVFIPENEIIRLIVNEDENGKGHSIIEPSLFPARMYLLLTMYNMIYTLNNNTTRIHYLKSSGLNKDYAAQVQRAMRKFQSRRITIDDIYSYSGVLNKVGGMGEMVLPSGRGDYKAIETDTIAAVDKPIDTDFLEQQRRQAISGTGVPALMVINAIDEVDFAKTLELANTRYLSTVSSYKIDFNKGLTRFYKVIIKYNTDLTDEDINSFLYKFNNIRQPALNVTNQMIGDFNTLNELTSSIYFSTGELQDADSKPSNIAIALKRTLAEEYLPQLDYSKLDEIVEKVRIKANEMTLKQKASDDTINADDMKSIKDAK